ncbi:MAG: hypothetical protein ACO21S_07050, partial [Sediminibacterium sp.]
MEVDLLGLAHSLNGKHHGPQVAIFSKPNFLLLGQGFNAHDWSMDFKNLLMKADNDGTKTELTYLEYLRVFGVFFGTVLNFMTLSIPVIVFRYYHKFNFLVIGILIYLL